VEDEYQGGRSRIAGKGTRKKERTISYAYFFMCLVVRLIFIEFLYIRNCIRIRIICRVHTSDCSVNEPIMFSPVFYRVPWIQLKTRYTGIDNDTVESH